MPSAIIISVASEQKYRFLETLYKVSSQKGLVKENENFLFDERIPFAENTIKELLLGFLLAIQGIAISVVRF